ncbi:sperm acrosome membrane-associated protein 6 isoform X3 [Podarcis raffonei]|uniref:sperm acrosome membrane-associated protein 6 isoform X3 n=1 Tax=Podarcis raffonei TaxID=65483 RepID=UPI0023291496|nr:sperm acrosome membrane-associated protein 6 isoform X3 [Podarcis raffonei]
MASAGSLLQSTVVGWVHMNGRCNILGAKTFDPPWSPLGATLLHASHEITTSSVDLPYDITGEFFSWAWFFSSGFLSPLRRLGIMLTIHFLLLWLAFSAQATACLLCFTTQRKRARVCQHFFGHRVSQHGNCQPIMERAFARFAKTQVDASEIEKLKDIFGRMIFFLEEKSMAKVPYPLAVKEAEKQVEKEMAQLKAAPACIPPCVQDVHKSEGDVTLLSCGVKFEIPEDATFRWKFAKEIRTNKVFLFQDLNFGFNPSLLIRPTLGSHHGTFACQIAGEDGVLVRKFFYLNVTEKRLHLEKELQEMFKAILNPPPMVEVAGETWGEEVQTNLTDSEMPSLEEILSGPDFLHKKVVVFLIVGIAMLSTLATMIAMTIYRWATDIKL